MSELGSLCRKAYGTEKDVMIWCAWRVVRRTTDEDVERR